MPDLTGQAKPLRVLIIEDVENDALLLVDTLETGSYKVDWRRVENEAVLRMALAEPWDIVFSDFSMPGFSGANALDILRQYDPDIPFVFVSGTIGEEAAVEAMKAGAQDYVMKGQLARVLPTVERELREVRMRRERRQVEAARARLVAILEATPDMVAILGTDGGLRYMNKSGRHLLALNGENEINSRYLMDFFPEHMAEQLILNVIPLVLRDGMWSGESIIQVSQREIPVSLVMLAHYGNDGSVEYLSAIARDISERKRFEAEMQHQATHDSLTDLPNRFLLMDRFAASLERARRAGTYVAVMFLDLDNFKRVNDSLGHAAGDTLLQLTARRMQNSLRPIDTVARHGGDEFSILVSDLGVVENALTVLRKLKKTFERPFTVNLQEVYVTFSTGIALYPYDGERVEDLLRHADTAMYRAKSSGSNQYRFYAPYMNARGHELLEMEADLRHALNHQEFLLHYQPQVDLRTGRVVGAESLLRWQHQTHGLISPAEFIPLLENSGLIIPVGEWVIRKACATHRQWAQQGYDSMRIAVNVSATQFNDPDLLDKIRRAINEEKMPPQSLELEITENIVMQEPEEASEILRELHAHGVRTAIDDFGTGYSSLAYLKRFPLNVLKIDQSFVHDLGGISGDDAIVEASILMAQKLCLDVVAEGVETQAQLEFLRSHGCEFVQGYYLSRPQAESKITDLLGHVWQW